MKFEHIETREVDFIGETLYECGELLDALDKAGFAIPAKFPSKLLINETLREKTKRASNLITEIGRRAYE